MLSILNFIIYLILCKIEHHRVQYKPITEDKKKLIDLLKNITFNSAFVFLTIIPLICSALDVLYLIEGMIGMMAVSTVQILIDNGRKKWDI
jgi:hypothetical protein